MVWVVKESGLRRLVKHFSRASVSGSVPQFLLSVPGPPFLHDGLWLVCLNQINPSLSYTGLGGGVYHSSKKQSRIPRSVCPSSIYSCVYLFIHPSTHFILHLSFNVAIHPFCICLSMNMCLLATHTPTHWSSLYLSVYTLICPSTFTIQMYAYICQSRCPRVCFSVHPFTDPSDTHPSMSLMLIC